LNIVALTYLLLGKTLFVLYEYHHWPIVKGSEKSIIHSFAKSDATKIPVYPEDGNHDCVDFCLQKRVWRLLDTESPPFQRVAKFYHLETFTLHKRHEEMLGAAKSLHQSQNIHLMRHGQIEKHAFCF